MFANATLVGIAFDLFGQNRSTRHSIRMAGLLQNTDYMVRITAGGARREPPW